MDPDIIPINEFAYEANPATVDLFRTNYLGVPHNGDQPVSCPLLFVGFGQHGRTPQLRPTSMTTTERGGDLTEDANFVILRDYNSDSSTGTLTLGQLISYWQAHRSLTRHRPHWEAPAKWSFRETRT